MKHVIKVFQILLAVYLIYFAFRLILYHYYLVTFPYPNTYREGASMATTSLLLEGIRPFNFILEPQYTNVYGIVYSLLCLPFAYLFGNTLVVHRCVTAFFIFASCSVIFLVLFKKKTPFLLNFWAVLALYASLLYPLTSTPCVDPASTALFFMLLCLFIPYLLDYSYLSLLISIIFGVLAFYTKPYFILGIPVILSYLFFFISKKKSLFFACSFLVFFVISAIAINSYFPSYFDDCLFLHFNFLIRDCLNTVLIQQLDKFFDLNKGMFLLLLVAVTYGIWERFKSRNTPLIIGRMPLEIYAGICFAIILMILMGKKPGANLWYFFQLFSPFGVCLIATLAARFKLWPVLFSFLLIYNLFSLTSDDDCKYFNKESSGWQAMAVLVKSQSSIFNSPLIAPLMIQEKKEVFDDGHTEYFEDGGKRKGLSSFIFHLLSPLLKKTEIQHFNDGHIEYFEYGHKGLMGWFFRRDKAVFEADHLFEHKLEGMLINKKFDLFIIEAGYSSIVMPYNFAENYKYTGSYAFQEDEFNKNMTPEALISALKVKSGISVSPGDSPIDSLNYLLQNAYLYKVMPMHPKDTLAVIGKLAAAGQDESPFELIKLNRRLIEANFPLQAPQSQFLSPFYVYVPQDRKSYLMTFWRPT